jgi:hypothetical protein
MVCVMQTSIGRAQAHKYPKGARTPGSVFANSGPPGVPGRPFSVVVASITIEALARPATGPANDEESIEEADSIMSTSGKSGKHR